MKKIISLLSVFAMIATMFTNVAFADANNYYAITEVSNADNTLVLNVTANTDKLLKTLSITLSMADIVTDEYGLTMDDFTVTKGADATVGNKSDSKKNIAFNVTSATADATGAFELGTITINTTNLKKDFNLPAPTLKIQDGNKVNVAGDFTDAISTYVVKAPVTGPELVANPYVFSFDADEETEVKITNSRTGDRTYSLPSFVKGGAKVNALLKIKAGSDVQTGDKFTIDAIKGGKATTITTIEVE